MCIRDSTESELTAAVVESFFTAFIKTEAGAGDNPFNEVGSSLPEVSRDPVSYTHLDVYKRQGLGRQVSDVPLDRRQQVVAVGVAYLDRGDDALLGELLHSCLLYTSPSRTR